MTKSQVEWIQCIRTVIARLYGGHSMILCPIFCSKTSYFVDPRRRSLKSNFRYPSRTISFQNGALTSSTTPKNTSLWLRQGSGSVDGQQILNKKAGRKLILYCDQRPATSNTTNIPCCLPCHTLGIIYATFSMFSWYVYQVYHTLPFTDFSLVHVLNGAAGIDRLPHPLHPQHCW